MPRDNRISRILRDPKPAKVERALSTSDRVELIVRDVLKTVSKQIDKKHAHDPRPRKR